MKVRAIVLDSGTKYDVGDIIEGTVYTNAMLEKKGEKSGEKSDFLNGWLLYHFGIEKI
jgi:hypothetical protein